MRAESKVALVPKLRFREFRGGSEWTDTSIDSILKTRDERRLPSALAPLFSLTIESGITEKTDRYNREFLVRDAGNKKYKLVEPDDIVYNPANLRWGAINYSQLAHSVVVSPIYEVLCLKDRSDYLLEFITYAIMREEQIKRFIKKAQGTLVERIAVKIEDFLSTKMPVPRAVFEQQKIAECLSSLDDAIAAQARKVDALKKHKKGLMQQLFPREGETKPCLPERRFPEFRNEAMWHPSELGSLAIILKGKGISKADLDPNGSQPCIRYGELYTRYGEIISKVISRTKVPRSQLFFSEPNDVIIPSSGETKIDIAKASCVLAGGIALGGDLNVIRTKLNGIFLSYYLNGPKRLDIAKVAQGDTVVHLYPHQLEALHIAVPSIAEQQRIASCLSSLDSLISAEIQKFDTLKIHKKSLLQQLFPPSKEAEK